MSPAKDLRTLSYLQGLREEYRRLRLSRAVSMRRKSADALGRAHERVASATAELTRLLDESAVDLDQLQIRTRSVSQMDHEFTILHRDNEQAESDEQEARIGWRRAERQKHYLHEHYLERARYEQRRSEDNALREFLSIRAARKGQEE